MSSIYLQNHLLFTSLNFQIRSWTFALHLTDITKKKQFKNDINIFIRKVKLKTTLKIKNKTLKSENLEFHITKHGHQRKTTTQ